MEHLYILIRTIKCIVSMPDVTIFVTQDCYHDSWCTQNFTILVPMMQCSFWYHIDNVIVSVFVSSAIDGEKWKWITNQKIGQHEL